MVPGNSVEQKRLVKVESYFVAIIVLLLSYFVGQEFIYGDQYHYRNVYNGIDGLGYIEGFKWYITAIFSVEVVHYSYIWLTHHFVEKDIAMSAANSVLAMASYRVLRSWGAYSIIAFLLVVFGFYWQVFYYSAERLKFGFIFLFLALLYEEKKKSHYLLTFLSIASHVQMLIIFGARFFQSSFRSASYFLKTLRVPKGVFILFSIGVIFFLFFMEHIVKKVSGYAMFGGFEPSEIMKMIVFLIISLVYTKRRWSVFLLFIPLILAAYVVGGMRVNIFGYFLALYCSLSYRRGVNLGAGVLVAYSVFGGVSYIYNVFLYGSNTLENTLKYTQ
ncbi:hypothetical protein KKI34_14400 [Pseudoalteromonas tetraodonis]|uniref:hypothetical protein n=1 Tax=Pseudoalteromonas tetraodonis TaxID=43659 RepID=UPI001BDDCB46|nr:hypothetical protein [Pseudoalteromonas tetraodonis]MBT2152932.1 hypothetical protein [Pseudoalteromonas tetraodonis]